MGNLTHITFGHNWNQAVEPLSKMKRLEHLIFGHNFDQPVDSLCVCPNLKQVVFGENFSFHAHGLTSVTEITFLGDCRYALYNLPNLTHLTFGESFNRTVDLSA